MSAIGQYLLSVVAAAVIVSISNTFIEKKSMIGSVMKLMTGMILAMVIVAPWTSLRLSDIKNEFLYTEADASALVCDGQLSAMTELSQYIKNETSAYILDKAVMLGLSITADICLTEESPPSIHKITIKGDASPYAKQRLIQIICSDLGVTEENLIWS